MVQACPPPHPKWASKPPSPGASHSATQLAVWGRASPDENGEEASEPANEGAFTVLTGQAISVPGTEDMSLRRHGPHLQDLTD